MQSLLYGLTAGSILLLTFLILTNPQNANQKANRWMAFCLFSIFCLLVDECFFSNKIYQQFPQIYGISDFTIFTTAPTVFLSVQYFTSPDKKFSVKDLWHFALTFLFLPINLLNIFNSNQSKLEFINQIDKYQVIQATDYVFLSILWVQMLIYLILSYRKIIKHQQNIQIFSSNTQKISLNWLKYFIIGIGFMLLMWVFDIFYGGVQGSVIAVWGYFFSVFLLAYFVIRQEEIFPFAYKEIVEITEIIEENTESNQPKQKHFTDSELESLKQKLLFLIETEKPFLDDTISLPKLATKMQISSHHLSYLINEGFGDNFFNFINKYRVEEAKSLLISPKFEQLNMLGIAFESGFSSKTTFNTTFKKITGVSPSEFQKNISSQKSRSTL